MQKQRLVISMSSLVALLVSFPLTPSVDAVSARSDYSLNPNNWFGSLTPFVYGQTPGGGNYWFYCVALFQVASFTAGLILLVKNRRISNKSSFFFAFFGATYSAWVIRDSLLFSLMILALGLLVANLNSNNAREKFFVFFGLCLLLISLTIRPFLGIAFILVFFLIFKNLARIRIIAVFLAIIFSVVPLALDTGFSRILGQSNSYPAQQIVIFDIAQMACWSSNEEVRSKALNALLPLADAEHFDSLCENLKPYNWQFLVYGFESNSANPLKRLTKEDSLKYKDLNSSYVHLSLQRPDEFIKIKFRNFSELMFVNGQFDGLENSGSLNSSLLKVLDKLHLFSWIVMIPFIGFLIIHKAIFRRKNKASSDAFVFSILASGILMIPLISIFYVGAIGRYTFLPVFILLLSIALFKERK